MTYTTKEKHISVIRQGDTIMHNDEIVTVCNSNIKTGFFGVTLFGDSYNMGTKPVTKINNIKF